MQPTTRRALDNRAPTRRSARERGSALGVAVACRSGYSVPGRAGVSSWRCLPCRSPVMAGAGAAGTGRGVPGGSCPGSRRGLPAGRCGAAAPASKRGRDRWPDSAATRSDPRAGARYRPASRSDPSGTPRKGLTGAWFGPKAMTWNSSPASTAPSQVPAAGMTAPRGYRESWPAACFPGCANAAPLRRRIIHRCRRMHALLFSGR